MNKAIMATDILSRIAFVLLAYASTSFPVPSVFDMKPIGKISSPYVERQGTPRQASSSDKPQVMGKIIITDPSIPPETLSDLDGFDYCWVIAVAHLNMGNPTTPGKPKFSAMVVPPRGPRIKRGLFSTRSPHRPNPLTLSALKIVTVDKAAKTIEVLGCDLLDNTPVLDIKPYVPYCDSFPGAKSGWLDGANLGA